MSDSDWFALVISSVAGIALLWMFVEHVLQRRK